ncbi:hypothetical protein GOODEAATRI_018828, partial [Goodea atripinnis]
PLSQQRLLTWLSVLEYVEVFLEIGAGKLWGEAGRWLQQEDTCFVGPRSGRVIRPLGSAPSLQNRLWGAPTQRKRRSSLKEKTNSRQTDLSFQETLAESVYISRPLVHRILSPVGLQSTDSQIALILFETLKRRSVCFCDIKQQFSLNPFFLMTVLCLGLCGKQSWKPWLVSVALELSSFAVLSDAKFENRWEKAEMKRRSFLLSYYLLRSPFYDKYSETTFLTRDLEHQTAATVVKSRVPYFRSDSSLSQLLWNQPSLCGCVVLTQSLLGWW